MDFLYIALITLIFLGSFLLSIKKFYYGFWLLVVLSPLVHKEYFSLGVWNLFPSRIAFAGVGAAALYHFYKYLRENKRTLIMSKVNEFVYKDPFLILLAILWVVRGISIFKSSSVNDSLLLFLFYSSIVIYYVFLKTIINKHKEKFFEKTINLYLGVGVATGIFAVVQYLLRILFRKTIGGVWVVPGYTPRLGSTFWDVNHFAGFLITLIPIFFAFFFYQKKKLTKMGMLVLAGFSVWLLFMTQSRSAWIGLGIGMFVSMIIYFLSKLRAPLVVLAASFIIFSAGLFSYTTMKGISIRHKIATFMHYRLDSTDTHFLLLEGASEIFLNNQLIGSGYGSFDPAFKQTNISVTYFDREPKLKTEKVPPHSVWGEVLAETGGTGIVIYGLFAVLLLASLISKIFTSKNNRQKYFGIGIFGSVASILVSGLFYSYNLDFYWIILFLGIFYLYLYPQYFSLKEVFNFWYSNRILPYLIILPPALFYVFLRLGTTGLIDWDEAIYGKVAKNILLYNDWFTLRWEDAKNLWFEKPPLYMWMSALAFKLTGFNSLGARLPSAVAGVFGVVLAYKFGSKLYNKLTGVFASLILLSTIHYLYYSRNGMLDVMVSLFITAAVYFYYLWILSNENHRARSGYMILSGVATGLAVMTKGVIGFIPVFIFAGYFIYLKKRGIKTPVKHIVLFILSFLIVALPWHVYSIWIHGEDFYNKYFLDHMLGRGLTGFGHEQPFFWFVEVIKVSFRVWVLPLIAGLLALPFIDKTKKREFLLLILSSFIVLILFSISKDKLQWYIIPIYPFLSVISARAIERFLVKINSLLKSDVIMDFKILRIAASFFILIFAVFYIISFRDRVFYPDFNKNKVALVNIFNTLYPIKNTPDVMLYYSEISKPVLLFYSDHEIKAVEKETILEMIDEAKPDQRYVFLTSENKFYSVQKMQSEISAPLVLDIQGASGGWILFRSKSSVDLLYDKYELLYPQVYDLELKTEMGSIIPLEAVVLKEIRPEFNAVVAKLTEYGYPPDLTKLNEIPLTVKLMQSNETVN